MSGAISVVDMSKLLLKRQSKLLFRLLDNSVNSWKMYKISAHCWKNELRP